MVKLEIGLLVAVALGVLFLAKLQMGMFTEFKTFELNASSALHKYEDRIAYLERENEKLRCKVNDLTVRMISPTPPESSLGPVGNLEPEQLELALKARPAIKKPIKRKDKKGA